MGNKEMLIKVLTLVAVAGGDTTHPVLSHPVGRIWYYHTGGPLHLQGAGAGGDLYEGAYHPPHNEEEGSPLGPSIGQKRLLVLPASTQLLNTRGHQPGTIQLHQPGTIQLHQPGTIQLHQPPYHSGQALLSDSSLTDSLKSDSLLTDSLVSDSLVPDNLLSDSSIEDLE